MLLILRKYSIITQPQAAILFEFVERNRFYCFAIGGLAAYYLKYNHPYISIVKKTAVQLIAIIILLIFLSPFTKGIFWGVIMHESVAVASAVIIIGCTARLRGYSILGSRPLRYLGKISYGVYCYHSIATVLVFKIFSISVAENTAWQILLYTAAMGTTIIMASISYYLLEKPFLALKQKYY